MSNTYDGTVIDEVFDVENDDAIRTGREVAQQEGLLVGISAGAALFAAAEIAKREENKGKKIVVLLPDTGERYLLQSIIGCAIFCGYGLACYLFYSYSFENHNR